MLNELIAVDNSGWSSEMFSSAAAYIWNTATFTNSRVLWMLPSDELQFWEARRHRVAKSGRQWIMIKLSSCMNFPSLPVFIHSTWFLAWYCPEPFNFEVRNFRKTARCSLQVIPSSKGSLRDRRIFFPPYLRFFEANGTNCSASKPKIPLDEIPQCYEMYVKIYMTSVTRFRFRLALGVPKERKMEN